MDIAPTILKRFGVKLNSIEPKLDGKPFDLPLIDKMIKSKEKQN